MEKLIGITPESISTLDKDEIFVFGSNLAGNHMGGAARTALRWGAVMGKGTGMQGQTYAIPTMFRTVDKIKPYVDEFIAFAVNHPEYRFLVTKLGCGIAGFTYTEMAELFRQVVHAHIQNIYLPIEFVHVLVRSENSVED